MSLSKIIKIPVVILLALFSKRLIIMTHLRLSESSFLLNSGSLSSSLCDGVAKRLFKEVSESEQNSLIEMGFSPEVSFHDVFKKIVANGKRFSKAETRKAMFYFARSAITMLINDKDRARVDSSKNLMSMKEYLKNDVFMKGVQVYNSAMHIVTVDIYSNKPHQSYFSRWPISFSMHALSRILYRFKPVDLIETLTLISLLFNDLLTEEKLHGDVIKKTDEGLKWIVIESVGAFLWAPSDDGFSDNLVTFVDEQKLSDSQIEMGKKTKLYLTSDKGPERTKTFLHLIMRNLLENKGAEQISMHTRCLKNNSSVKVSRKKAA